MVPPSWISRYDYRWGVSPFVMQGGVWPPMDMPPELRELLWPARPAVNGHGALEPVLTRKYISVAIEHELDAVASATEGTRNDQLNRSAFALARFVRDGVLPASTYVEQLTAAASRIGLSELEIRRTLASALRGRT